MARLELYGTARCPHTGEMREWLEWKRSEFVEYDVEADPGARARMREIARGQRTVPILVEDGKIIQVGWQGHGCIMESKCGRANIVDDTNGQRLLHRVRGVVQGVGFRPFVYRLACANTLNGWVLNGEEGVEIHLEGAEAGLEALCADLKAQPPPAASICGNRCAAGRTLRPARIHHPREPAAGTPDGSNFAGLAGL